MFHSVPNANRQIKTRTILGKKEKDRFLNVNGNTVMTDFNDNGNLSAFK